MAVRRVNNNHTLPPNAIFVEFPRSDGDSSTWPTDTECKTDKDGNVNFFRPVELDESLSIHWRKATGPKVAEILGLPDGKPYVLKSFPTGYKLFDHNKGKRDNPRHDAYLYGSTRIGKQRFRSINEFIPHAIWLASNNPSAICLCKYCSGKKTQTEISQSLGLSVKRPSGVGSAASTPPRQTQRRHAPYSAPQPKPPHAAIRHAPKPIKPPPIGPAPAPKQTLALDKSNDIQNALTVREVQDIRYFRKGELVWCALNPPIYGLHDEADAILFWPGLVDTITTKALTIPQQDSVHSDVADMLEPISPNSPPKAQITWSVKQQTSYRVKLLATAHCYFTSDAEMLPYLSYAPSETLLESLRAALPEALQSSASRALASQPALMSPFNPQDQTIAGSERYREAITPYTLAIQIASHIATYWCPTDEWECKFSIPPPSPPSTQTSDVQVPSLQDVINSAMSNNANRAAPPHPEPDTVAHTRSSDRVAAQTQNVVQLRYQGLWWGAERIWTDELVRLKLARCQFAPQGAQAVYAPAGPSKRTQQWNEEHGIPNDDPVQGAGEKGMFMRIEGLFVVDVPKPNGEHGTIKECRASGMLYELVDEDWVDPEGPSQNGATHTNGKGKERAQEEPAAAGTASPSNDLTAETGFDTDIGGVGPSTTESVSAPAPLRRDESLSSSNLSRPILTTPFPLPDPPQGYRFHAILPPGNECVLSLSLISGRYYPRLFKHPLLQPVVEKALEVPIEQGGLLLNKHLWSMEGLLPGVHQSMDPEQWKESRHIMFRDADTEARSLLLQEIEQQAEIQDAMARSASVGPSFVEMQESITMDVVMDSIGPIAGPSSISAAV